MASYTFAAGKYDLIRSEDDKSKNIISKVRLKLWASGSVTGEATIGRSTKSSEKKQITGQWTNMRMKFEFSLPERGSIVTFSYVGTLVDVNTFKGACSSSDKSFDGVSFIFKCIPSDLPALDPLTISGRMRRAKSDHKLFHKEMEIRPARNSVYVGASRSVDTSESKVSFEKVEKDEKDEKGKTNSITQDSKEGESIGEEELKPEKQKHSPIKMIHRGRSVGSFQTKELRNVVQEHDSIPLKSVSSEEFTTLHNKMKEAFEEQTNTNNEDVLMSNNMDNKTERVASPSQLTSVSSVARKRSKSENINKLEPLINTQTHTTNGTAVPSNTQVYDTITEAQNPQNLYTKKRTSSSNLLNYVEEVGNNLTYVKKSSSSNLPPVSDLEGLSHLHVHRNSSPTYSSKVGDKMTEAEKRRRDIRQRRLREQQDRESQKEQQTQKTDVKKQSTKTEKSTEDKPTHKMVPDKTTPTGKNIPEKNVPEKNIPEQVEKTHTKKIVQIRTGQKTPQRPDKDWEIPQTERNDSSDRSHRSDRERDRERDNADHIMELDRSRDREEHGRQSSNTKSPNLLKRSEDDGAEERRKRIERAKQEIEEKKKMLMKQAEEERRKLKEWQDSFNNSYRVNPPQPPLTPLSHTINNSGNPSEVSRIREWEINKREIQFNSVRVKLEAECRNIVPSRDGKYSIGRGGFGSIYLVEYNCTLAAMKHLDAPPGDTTADKEFLQELDILLRLRHPNILLYLGGSANRHELFFLTELMECDLNRMIKSKESRALWQNEGKLYALDILQAVTYIHKKNLVHKDVKTLNILVRRGSAKLGDFGLAKSIGNTLRITRERAYSAAWASPEQLNPRSLISFPTDVYSFAIVVWEIFSQQEPWEGCTDLQLMFATASGQFKDYHPFPPETPKEMSDLCQACWSLYPQNRPTAEEFLQCLEKMKKSGTW